MVQLRILSGKKAGAEWIVRHFPFRIGRGPDSDLCLEDQGVWENHLEIQLLSEGRFILSSQSGVTSVNGQAVQQAILRNWDLLELGSLQIRFGISPSRQHNMRWREAFTWIGLGAVCLGQVVLINWLAG